MKGHTNEHCEALLAEHLGLPPEAGVAARKERHYREVMVPRYLRLHEGARELIDQLAGAGVALGILTNAPPENVAAAEAKLALSRLIPAEHTVTADELATFVGETLASHKVPAHWEIRSEPLPRNAAGTVVKGVLTGERTLDQLED